MSDNKTTVLSHTSKETANQADNIHKVNTGKTAMIMVLFDKTKPTHNEGLVAQMIVDAIHWINHYLVHS